jgi:hypothetical protein
MALTGEDHWAVQILTTAACPAPGRIKAHFNQTAIRARDGADGQFFIDCAPQSIKNKRGERPNQHGF